MKSHLEVGQKVKLSKLDSFNASHQELLTKVEAEVVAVADDFAEVKLLNLDKSFDEIKFIRIGIILNLCFAGDDALYKVGVEVNQIRDVSNLVLVQRSLIQRIQRRRSFRIPVEEEIKYIFADKDLDSDKDKTNSAMMLDISAVGLKMKVESLANIEQGDILGITLNLDFLENEFIKGRVVRTEEKRKIIGIDFIKLPESTRQKLTRWVFEKEEKVIKQSKKDLSK
ncbi:MAG: flagellar brake protein [Bacillota bacterium]